MARWVFLYFMLAGAAFVLMSLRRSDLLTNPQFWAEDGSVYFFTQLVDGTRAALFQPYAGYLLLIPRLVAASATLSLAHRAPLIYSLAALTIDALCCSLFLLPWYRPLIRSDAMRAILCLYMASGIFAHELIGVLTNAQWYLAMAMLLMLVLPDDVPNLIHYGAAALCLIAGLSAGSGILLVPFALVKIWRTRNRAALPAAVVVFTSVVQTVCMVVAPPPSVVHAGWGELLRSIVIAFDYRVVMSSLIGCPLALKMALHNWIGAALAALAGTVVWVLALWWTSSRERKWELVACGYLTLSCIASALYLRALTSVFSTWNHVTAAGERYFLFGGCIFVYLIAVSIERWLPRLSSRAQAAVLVLVLASSAVGNYPIAPMQDFGWRESGLAVDQWVSDTQAHRPARAVGFAINPLSWTVILPGTPGR